MKLKYVIYPLIFLGIAYLVYYRISANKKLETSGTGTGAKGSQANKDGKNQHMAVNGIVVQPVSFANQLDITGTIEANESVALQSEVSGLVTGIFFKEGSNVTKGSVLVKINDRDIQAQLQESLTKQNLSATNENRARQLLQKGAISQEEYDTALADLKSLKAQAQLIRAQLAKTSIIAPFSGKIGLRSISSGVYITPSTVIANLLSTNPVKISFSVPEKYMAQIKVNSTITFRTDGSAQLYTGKVFALEPGINAQTRTLQVKALAANTNNELRPGSFAKISLTLDKIDNAILIPNQAIIPVLKGKTVFISYNGKAKQVEVQSGTRTDENILITSGLKIGDTVLTTGALSLKDEAPVKVSVVKN
ncbi:efflux RND transporter periplasmic adaptor subunit [Pedobacter cryoconitis]|uniref:Membrane fusion protein (Multidrug efflux system) n=1 Tax=Pedobacter cryoconitis TaxID=188932 RepID=A0A7X0J7R0_9SPHI|nr:efflux RND transporter periplasmic adaptor subunit [Pedobacter cryoconitis]MBB6501387.1 membrane fusion protein (multidrug efflux system) [Pedobacter cryoconitis]